MKELSEFIGLEWWHFDEGDSIFGSMVGNIVNDVVVDKDCDTITFKFNDADVVLYHEQYCCEAVVIDDINGDFGDIIGEALLVAEERVSDQASAGDGCGTETWTFYTFRTVKGSVDVKWHGSSSGYYSEQVDVRVVAPTHGVTQ